MHTEKIGVIDRLGYTWCLKCERRAKTTETTDVIGEASSNRAAYSPHLATEMDRCDGCYERMLDQMALVRDESDFIPFDTCWVDGHRLSFQVRVF